ncbi:MAG: hypothetical protein ABF443_09165 [Acetobacter malorum]|uniref:hypothetical protein n=1 Tax=Acetobacter malorum TaxID=178901 RepID=UPI0012E85477|nr:hypothetical protein [Acetobacter malorum]
MGEAPVCKDFIRGRVKNDTRRGWLFGLVFFKNHKIYKEISPDERISLSGCEVFWGDFCIATYFEKPLNF